MSEQREIVKKLDNADKAARGAKPDGFKWTFERLGGVDQVVLHTSDDLRHLGELDPKLWVALSCPASGLEFDQRTLTLIDQNKDGRIRIPEVVEAVNWTCARLKEPSGLVKCAENLELDEIDDSTPEGKRLVATGRAILANLGRPDATSLSQQDVTKSAAHASEQLFNGDGILPPAPEFGDMVNQYIRDALAVIGGVEDAGGQTGINREISDAFITTLTEWLAWRQTVDQAATPLGEKTQEAWDLLSQVKGKIDDYFLRCELAAYAPETRAALNLDERQITPDEKGLLVTSALTDLPLSKIDGDKPLDLTSGINPVWRDRIEQLWGLIAPMLKTPGILTRDDWRALQKTFAPYAGALAKKPEQAKAATTVPPTWPPDKLGEERVKEILDSRAAEEFGKLADKDAGVPAAAADIAEVERLVLYHKYLHRLLINFVSFEEFFLLQSRAAFQSGTLYIDGRSCRLCMPAEKVEEHSLLASNSQLYLLYCACSRNAKPGSSEPVQTMNIVAAVTAGDADLLIQNRNGVFIDNRGEDWDATVVKIVSNPIGLWQAVWNPYKKFGNMITEQLGKFANDKQATLFNTAGKKLEQSLATIGTPPPASPPTRFDIGRNVGIFAAVGIALGAIGTAVGSIARALFAMQWWQFPVLIFGLFAIISGPSLLIAWLKLRQRTLGPLLEASGWAINGKVSINYALSRRLTGAAVLPGNSRRSKNDPLAATRRWRMAALVVGILLGALLWFGVGSCRPDVGGARPAGAVVSPDTSGAAGRAGEGEPSSSQGVRGE